MTVDLVKAIRQDFPGRPIHLFGVSWGSILAVLAVSQLQGIIDRVIIYGQVTSRMFVNDEVFAQLRCANLKDKERKQLEEMAGNAELSAADVTAMAGFIQKYTEGYQAKNGGKIPLGKLLWGVFTSPDYAFKDFKAVLFNGAQKNKSLFQALLQVDVTDTLKTISVPYLIFQGSTDTVTSTKNIERLVQEAHNPHLQLYIVQDSGHMPGANGMEDFLTRGFAFLKEGQA